MALARTLSLLRGVRTFSLLAPAPLPARVSGWTLQSRESFAALGVTAHTFTHASGATLVHADADDAHLYFSVAFRTPAYESTGVAHVLEHTLLCGSREFEVKDPFHSMRKRSLQTDSNAVTCTDHTTLYFSTCSGRDYSNLLRVFLDAAFFPTLREGSFAQEGHRIEPLHIESPLKHGLALRGVVFNEMSGYAGSASEHISRALYASLLPGTPYAVSHGGDPSVIPDLTYERLCSFHRNHYTPHNALFVTYGRGLDVSATLLDIEARALGGGATPLVLSHLPPLPPLPLASSVAPGTSRLLRVLVPLDGTTSAVPASSPPHVVDSTPLTSPPPTSRTCTYLRSWVCGSTRDVVHDPYHHLTLRLATDLLLAGTDSPLFRLLIESGLATHLAPGTGFDASTLQPVLTLGAAGVSEADVAKVDAAIEAALAFAIDPPADGAHDPMSPMKVNALLHQMELGLRSRTPAFGSTIASGITEAWAHGSRDFLSGLRIEPLLTRLHADFDDTSSSRSAQVLRDALRKWTLENDHTIRLLAVPDASVQAKLAADTAARVAAAEATWTPQMRIAAADASREEAARRAREDPNALPCLPISEIPLESPHVDKTSRFVMLTFDASGDLPVPLQLSPNDSNGIATLRLFFPIALPDFAATCAHEGTDDTHPSIHPWYTHTHLSPLPPPLHTHLEDALHAWLPFATSFPSYGTRRVSSKEWEVETRLHVGRLSASIAAASPTLLPGSTWQQVGVGKKAQRRKRGDDCDAKAGAGAVFPEEGVSSPPLYGLVIQASWLVSKTQEAMALIEELLTSSAAGSGLLASRDAPLLRIALTSSATEARMSLGEAGEAYARSTAAAHLNPISFVRDIQSGVPSARLLQDLASGEAAAEAAAEGVVVGRTHRGVAIVARRVQEVVNQVITRHKLRADDPHAATWLSPNPTSMCHPALAATAYPLRATLSADECDLERLQTALHTLLSRLPVRQVSSVPRERHVAVDSVTQPQQRRLDVGGGFFMDLPRPVSVMPTSLPIPAPLVGSRPPSPLTVLHLPGASVFSVLAAISAPRHGTPHLAHLNLLLSLLTSTHLHEAVREAGGAYDVGARVDGCDECIMYTSEDPTPLESLQAFQAAARWAADGRFSAQDIREAKLAVLGELDAPVAPSAKGLAAFSYGVTQASQAAHRNHTLRAQRRHLRAAARDLMMRLEGARVVVAGNAELLPKGAEMGIAPLHVFEQESR